MLPAKKKKRELIQCKIILASRVVMLTREYRTMIS
jgi:hypothetical protein